MKSFVFRFLFVIIIVISIIASSTLSASAAESVTGDSEVYPFNVNSFEIEVYTSTGDLVPIDFTLGSNELYEGRIRFKITQSDLTNFSLSNTYVVSVSMTVIDSKFTDGSKCVAATYRFSTSTICAIQEHGGVANRSVDWGEGISSDGSFAYLAYNVCQISYPYSDIGDTYYKYFNKFEIKFNTAQNYFYVNLYHVDFSAISESVRASLLITENQDKNTDKILNAGSDVAQPDFDTTNGQLDDTTAQLGSIEGEYQIDQEETQTALDKGNAFISGSDLQRASVQVKTWIEKFTSDNPIMLGFFLSVMCLGLCLWIIGRKAGGG